MPAVAAATTVAPVMPRDVTWPVAGSAP